MLTKYTVIPPEGDLIELECELPDDPGLDRLCELVKPHLELGQELERVAVLDLDGRRKDMFVGEMGAQLHLPVNERATAIYWNASKSTSGPRIYGTVVLFHRKVWF